MDAREAMRGMCAGLVLVVPDGADVERDAVAAAWRSLGGEVVRLARFWEPPPLEPARVRLYGGYTFCLVVAHTLGLTLVSPDDAMLVKVPRSLLRREVRVTTLEAAMRGAFPCFAKPLAPKAFTAQVYASPEQLAHETRGMEPEAPVIVSEIVTLDAEARAFVVDGEVAAVATYEGVEACPEEAVRAVMGAAEVPEACVLDFGLVRGRGWAFLEANAAWGSGLNGCDALAVVPCLMRATAL